MIPAQREIAALRAKVDKLEKLVYTLSVDVNTRDGLVPEYVLSELARGNKKPLQIYKQRGGQL